MINDSKIDYQHFYTYKSRRVLATGSGERGKGSTFAKVVGRGEWAPLSGGRVGYVKSQWEGKYEQLSPSPLILNQTQNSVKRVYQPCLQFVLPF